MTEQTGREIGRQHLAKIIGQRRYVCSVIKLINIAPMEVGHSPSITTHLYFSIVGIAFFQYYFLSFPFYVENSFELLLSEVLIFNPGFSFYSMPFLQNSLFDSLFLIFPVCVYDILSLWYLLFMVSPFYCDPSV